MNNKLRQYKYLEKPFQYTCFSLIRLEYKEHFYVVLFICQNGIFPAFWITGKGYSKPNSSRSNYDHTTIYLIATRTYHASTAITAHITTIIQRSYHVHALRYYYVLYALSNEVNSVFNIHKYYSLVCVPFLHFLCGVRN